MNGMLEILLLSLGLIGDISGVNIFCNTSCGIDNTVCKRDKEECGLAQHCRQTYIYKQLSPEERVEILTIHNRYRSKIAMGEEARYRNKSVSNMMVLSYSPQLEYVAQCWANTCIYEHDLCRNTPNFPQVGQNVFIGFEEKHFYERAVGQWYVEVNYSDIKIMKNYDGRKILFVSSFTQLVWAKSYYIGCGRTASSDIIILVCNYFPHGNVMGESVVEYGSACSDCKGDCNRTFPGLCGTTKAISESWRGPFNLKSSMFTSDHRLISASAIICIYFWRE